MHEIFSNILDAINMNIRHLGNAKPETFLLVAGGIVLAAFLLFRR